MRPVKVFKLWATKESGLGFRKDDGHAMFHEWGCDYDEFESGPGNYSTAIIERDDGTVENVPADLIQFIN